MNEPKENRFEFINTEPFRLVSPQQAIRLCLCNIKNVTHVFAMFIQGIEKGKQRKEISKKLLKAQNLEWIK